MIYLTCAGGFHPVETNLLRCEIFLTVSESEIDAHQQYQGWSKRHRPHKVLLNAGLGARAYI